jgi:Na+/melibiose symporter-like transporter
MLLSGMESRSSRTLSGFQLFIYCSGGFAMNLTNLVLSQWLYERYVVGGVLGTTAFSLILLAGRITDGVSDPFFAFWTDNSWTRWGRRMPFLVLATLPLAAVCFFLWLPPEHASPSVRGPLCGEYMSGLFPALRAGSHSLSSLAARDRELAKRTA